MFSPALRNRQKLLARHSARKGGKPNKAAPAPAIEESNPATSEYQQLLAKLHDDLRALSEIQSIEMRIEKKRSMIQAFLPWCEGALSIEEGAQAPQDEILVTVMIWALDIQNWDLALTIAAHCIKHGLALPERYSRTLGCLVTEEIAEYAIQNEGKVPHEVLMRARPGDGPEYDMPDQARAKFHRALGESFARQAETFDPKAESAPAGGKPALIDSALSELHRALQLNKKVGVKKHVQELEREAKKLAQAAGEKD